MLSMANSGYTRAKIPETRAISDRFLCLARTVCKLRTLTAVRYVLILVKCISKIRRSSSSCEFRKAVIIANSQQVAFLNIRSRVLRIRPSPVIGIFLAVDGCYMRWIFIQIRPPNSKLVAVRVGRVWSAGCA